MAPSTRPGALSLRWTRLPDAAALARVAGERILALAGDAIARRGRFTLVLAGGSTPAATYARLAGLACDWSRWHLYFGDERCLPVDHPGRNSRLAARQLTDRVAIPADQVHPIPAEHGPEEGARRYARLLAGVPPFDLVLLGVGADGHTASLFPGQQHPPGATVVPVHDAPKPPAERVSLNYATLGACRQLLFLVSGTDKRNAIRAWRNGEATLPVSMVAPAGEGEVLVDRHAWPNEQAPA